MLRFSVSPSYVVYTYYRSCFGESLHDMWHSADKFEQGWPSIEVCIAAYYHDIGITEYILFQAYAWQTSDRCRAPNAMSG